MVFPVAAPPHGDFIKARDELDLTDVLGVLVAKPIFDPQFCVPSTPVVSNGHP
jgi:hypothetical protein